MSIQDTLRMYKQNEGITWQQMADAINQTPELEKPLTRQSLNNWAVGISAPDYYFLKHLEREGAGWVVLMAHDLLKAMSGLNDWIRK